MDIKTLVDKINQVDKVISTLKKSQNFSILTYLNGQRIVFDFNDPGDQIALAIAFENYRQTLKENLKSFAANI